MALAASIKKLFTREKIPYRVFEHQRTISLDHAIELAGVDKAKTLHTEVLRDNLGVVLAVRPLEKNIDFVKLKKHLQRDLVALSDLDVSKIFSDCEPGTYPPFGEPYNLQLLIDDSLVKFDVVYFKAGSQTSIIRLTIDDFLYLNANSSRLPFISEAKFCQTIYQATTLCKEVEEYEQALNSCLLPELPQVASKVLRFIKQGNQKPEELIKIIANNEAIHKQILNYAKLPFISRGKQVSTVQDAIKHLPGFEFVSHITLNVATGKTFQVAKDQNVYIKDFWQHALYCAIISERLAKHIEKIYSIDPSMSYTIGVFHNFGLLVLAQLFPPEFKLLSRWIRLKPNTPVTTLENRLLGMGKAQHILHGGHAKLGAWLLKHWGLPEQTWIAAMEHHNLQYQGKYTVYIRVLSIVNRILKEYKIGDGMPGEISNAELDFLNLSKDELNKIVAGIMSDPNNLERMAQTLTAN